MSGEQPAETKPDAVHTADDLEPGRWERLWHRVAHVYKTRVRTTTVILVVLFVVGLGLYGYTSTHYGIVPEVPEPRPVPTTAVHEEYPVEPQHPVPTTSEPVPSFDESGPSGTPDPSVEPEPSGVELSPQNAPESPVPTAEETGATTPR